MGGCRSNVSCDFNGQQGTPSHQTGTSPPAVFQDATRNLANYDPAYNYEHTAFIHLARLPLLGYFLQTRLSSVLPSWQEGINWTELSNGNPTARSSLEVRCYAWPFFCGA